MVPRKGASVLRLNSNLKNEGLGGIKILLSHCRSDEGCDGRQTWHGRESLGDEQQTVRESRIIDMPISFGGATEPRLI